MGSILEGFGTIFELMFWMCGVTFSISLQKWKMWFGLVICCESSTWSDKYVNFGGRFLDSLWDGILGISLHNFGTMLGAKLLKKVINKSIDTKVRTKSCDCPRVSAVAGLQCP